MIPANLGAESCVDAFFPPMLGAQCMATQREDRPLKDEDETLFGSFRQYLVTRRDILRFSHSIDAQWKRKDRLDSRASIMAPPLFCQTMAFSETSLLDLSRDGSPTEIHVLGNDKKVVGVGSEYHIARRLIPGEIIRVKAAIADVFTKKGRSGDLFFVVVDTEFEDEARHCVARERATYIQRPKE